MILSAALARDAFAAGRVLVIVFLTVTIAIGGYAAAAADALTWLVITKPSAATGYGIAVIALLTAFVSWIAFRTVLLAVHGHLIPA
jgi:hypothetical protein